MLGVGLAHPTPQLLIDRLIGIVRPHRQDHFHIGDVHALLENLAGDQLLDLALLEHLQEMVAGFRQIAAVDEVDLEPSRQYVAMLDPVDQNQHLVIFVLLHDLRDDDLVQVLIADDRVFVLFGERANLHRAVELHHVNLGPRQHALIHQQAAGNVDDLLAGHRHDSGVADLLLHAPIYRAGKAERVISRNATHHIVPSIRGNPVALVRNLHVERHGAQEFLAVAQSLIGADRHPRIFTVDRRLDNLPPAELPHGNTARKDAFHRLRPQREIVHNHNRSHTQSRNQRNENLRLSGGYTCAYDSSSASHALFHYLLLVIPQGDRQNDFPRCYHFGFFSAVDALHLDIVIIQ